VAPASTASSRAVSDSSAVEHDRSFGVFALDHALSLRTGDVREPEVHQHDVWWVLGSRFEGVRCRVADARHREVGLPFDDPSDGRREQGMVLNDQDSHPAGKGLDVGCGLRIAHRH
jgi:hypothetical protein